MSTDSSPPRFTETQGQYLAFIYHYGKVNRRPPAEADIQAFFGVTPEEIPPLRPHSIETSVPRY